MDTQYKFRWIMRDDDGWIDAALISFYEGEYKPNVPVVHPTTRKVLGTRNVFVIAKKLTRRDLWHLTSTIFNPENNAEVLYLPKHFGRISTDDGLKKFLNGEIAKDVDRKPIPEQEIKVDSRTRDIG